MKAFWTNTAIGNLESIHAYIAQDSPRYACRMIDRITARSQQFAAFPKSGQVVPEYQHPDIREVLVGSYRVIYLVESTSVKVLAVVHGAQLLSSEPPTE